MPTAVATAATAPFSGEPLPALGTVRMAQQSWAERPLIERLRVLRAFRFALSDHAHEVAQSVRVSNRRLAETLAAEVLPLADACQFLERSAAGLLESRSLGSRHRPWWLWGVRGEVRREPFGVVLIIGPANYPLMLPGVQAVQALTAGNAVLWKPAPGCGECASVVHELLEQCGLPRHLLTVLYERPESASAAIAAGADLVVLTGSASTGRTVLQQASSSLTPVICELSGCDAAFVLESADLDRAGRCLRFGLCFNGSATCIAPRRVFVQESVATEFRQRLLASLVEISGFEVSESTRTQVRSLVSDALDDGVRVLWPRHSATPAETWPLVMDAVRPQMSLVQADLFAPMLSLLEFSTIDDALQLSEDCPYALGASVFGQGMDVEEMVRRVDVGSVVVNDLIVPTADPRAPFQGRRQSGFGTTRGAEGLLALTRLKTVHRQTGRRLHHLDLLEQDDARMIQQLIAALHGRGLECRVSNMCRLLRSQVQRSIRGE